MPKPDAPELGTDGLDAPVLGDPRTRCAVLGTEGRARRVEQQQQQQQGTED